MRLDRGDHVADVFAHAAEIDLWLATDNAEAIGAADRVGRMGGCDQRLRGHAAAVQAIAAHFAPLDEHDPRAHLGGARGDGEPSGARPDDAQVGVDDSGHHGWPLNFSPSLSLGRRPESSLRPSRCCSAGDDPAGAKPARILSSRHFSLRSARRWLGASYPYAR